MPVFASRFRSAASPDVSVTLRCDSQARECRLVHASVGQPELERVEHVERVASLATARFFRSVGSSTPCSAIRASTVEIVRSDAVVPRHILFAHAERAPAVRRAVAGVAEITTTTRLYILQFPPTHSLLILSNRTTALSVRINDGS